MDNKGKLIGGILLLLLGIGLMLEVTHLIDFNFEGWWTAFIIIPCLISFFNSKNKTMPLIGVGTGVLLLLATRGIISWNDMWRYLICIVFIIWGIMLIFSRRSSIGCSAADKKNVEELKQINQDGRTIRQINASFGKQYFEFAGQRFEGARAQCSFGFVSIDLRHADILDGAVIDIECSFGGMEIIVGDDVIVKQAIDASFAGVECKEHLQSTANTKTIYLKGHCAFGGIEIK
ncbi:MAG: cell wall-active antibiotics response protein [Bacteroidales bacterium]|nr:cell wall-active antibiotics response protein [Bacteroidales bacterium]